MEKKYNTDFCDALIKETRRRLLEESIPRLEKCLNQLTDEDIWYRPNENSNSVGNLVLHLCGNVQQWVGSGLGHLPNTRVRDLEFDQRDVIPVEKLLEKLKETIKLVEEVLSKVQPEDLLKKHDVQVYEETGLSILVHVVEHFSYHVGQISYFVKAKKDIDLGYYEEDLG